jgi:hypothetical protein
MSTRPSKLFFYKILIDDLKNISKTKINFSVGDFACGGANILRYIKPKKYIGIDSDKSLIKKNNNKDVKFYNNNIENFYLKKKMPVVLCTETLGINKRFNNKTFVKVLKNLINSTKKNGYLLFNVSENIYNAYNKKIYELLKNHFKDAKIIQYGLINHRLPYLITKLLWRIEYLGLGRKYRYIYCKKKR